MSPKVLPAVLLALLAASAVAHEDDPKLLDRQPPFPGPGITTALPPAGTKLLAQTSSFPASNVQLLAWLTLGDLGEPSSGNDCWGYVSPSGREYAIIGLGGGTAWVEVTNPQAPVIVASLPGPTSTWRDVKVYQQYAYAVSEGGNGIQVFDMGQIDSGSVSLVNTVTFGGSTTATHNVAIDEQSGRLYRCGGNNHGLRIYDLTANPASPSYMGSWDVKYVHDAEIRRFGNQQIAFCCAGFNGGWSQTGLTVVDVTNPSNPTILDEISWPNPGYSHQIWLSDDGQYAYLNDELDENGVFPTTTYMFDVTNLSNLQYLGSFTNGNQSIGHNLYVVGNQIFEANYRSGLRVFDRTNPTNPIETAWFDTYPPDDSDQFNGLWSVFPFFPSGVVIGSDIEKGLFVWWVGAPLLDPEFAAGPPSLIDPAGESFTVTIAESTPGVLVQGTEALNYDTGAGLVSVPLTPMGAGTYSATFPALACGTPVQFFLSAQSTNGMTWYDPPQAPLSFHTALVAQGSVTSASFDMETPAGWTAGAPGDNATTGIWTRVDPIGTGSQPEDDHTVAGTDCWVTGQGSPGGSLGENDVDNGTTTLLSPTLDMSGLADPVVGYWRWYSNDGNGVVDDVFQIDVSSGGAWVNVETLGPTGLDSIGGWIYHEFRVSDFVTPGANVRLRFRASDLGSGSIVEAAIDDLDVRDVVCQAPPTPYCVPKISSNLCAPSIGFTGSPSVSGATFDVTATDIHNNKNGLLFYGYAQASLPFQGGTLCVQPPLRRTPVQTSGGAPPPADDCSGQLAYDFNALIQSGADPLLVAGSEVFSQYWFRDPGDLAGFGSGLSNGLRFTINP